MNLSPRQRDVLRHLLDGVRVKTMALRMGIEVRTAMNHKHELYQRLGVSTRGELMARYMQPTEEAIQLMNPTPPTRQDREPRSCTADSRLRESAGVGSAP
jgi:DNA-binding CsgD family transcriptional regulator